MKLKNLVLAYQLEKVKTVGKRTKIISQLNQINKEPYIGSLFCKKKRPHIEALKMCKSFKLRN